MKTAMQELIEWLEKQLANEYLSRDNKRGLEIAIEQAHKYLKKEKQAAQGKEVEFDENKAEEFICSLNFTSSKMDIDNILFTGDRVKKLLVLFNNHLFKSQL